MNVESLWVPVELTWLFLLDGHHLVAVQLLFDERPEAILDNVDELALVVLEVLLEVHRLLPVLLVLGFSDVRSDPDARASRIRELISSLGSLEGDHRRLIVVAEGLIRNGALDLLDGLGALPGADLWEQEVIQST